MTRGEIFRGDPRSRAEGVGSDSRQLRAGELFIPLRGPRFDGHEFIGEALAKGAAGSLVQRGWEGRVGAKDSSGKFFIAVDDVLRALGDLAHFWRTRQTAQIVAITGSNCKTTTKEMTAQILSERFRLLKT